MPARFAPAGSFQSTRLSRWPNWTIVAVLLLVGTVLPKGVGGQTASIFDLVPRLDPAQQAAILGLPQRSGDSVVVDPAAVGNPFDILRGGDPNGEGSRPARIDPIMAAGLERVPGVELGAKRGSFDTVLSFLLLVLLSIAFLVQGQSLRRMLAAVFNQNLLSRLLREQQRGGFYVWAVLGAVVVAAYLYASVRELHPEWLGLRWTALDGFMLAVAGLTLLKLGTLELLKVAFPLGKPIETYQMLIVIWLALLGVATFPLLVMVNFAPPTLAAAAAWASPVLIGTALLARSFGGVAAAGPAIANYPLQFFLYLCALEISPLLVIYTWLAGR